MLRRLAVQTSPDTLLRVIRAVGSTGQTAPRVLGIDDFAFRRGHRYGTISLDLEQHQVVDLLPDRKQETLIAWLTEHGVPEIISRDRGGGYAEAARKGAPDATQVADRFHLLQGLKQALERVFLHKRAVLKAAAAANDSSPPAQSSESSAPTPQQPPSDQTRQEEVSQERHAEAVARHERVHALRQKGVRIADIARRLGVSRKTVYQDLAMAEPPERKRPLRDPQERVLAPYEPYLVKRWEEGCHNGMQLWREISEQGYEHSRASVARFVAHLRREGRPPHPLGTTSSGLRDVKGPPPRRVALLCLQRPEQLDAEATAYIEEICRQDEVIATACRLSREFAAMVRGRGGDRLDGWIAAVREAEIEELCRFAAGLTTDYEAVKAGLTETWSNGQTEGQVHRLKFVKRSMYGRANFDLLRQRVLHAA